MSSAFDPYYEWLGIPPKDQPPHHYRLLGVELFETDEHLIEMATEQRILLVRSRQIGKHSDLSQRVLNEIAMARRALLDAATRGPYDAALRDKLGVSAAKPQKLATARPLPIPVTKPAPAATTAMATPIPVAAAPTGPKEAEKEAAPVVNARSSPARGGGAAWHQNPAVLAGIGAALLLLIGGLVWATRTPPAPPVVQNAPPSVKPTVPAPPLTPAINPPATNPAPMPEPVPPMGEEPLPAVDPSRPRDPAGPPEREPGRDPRRPRFEPRPPRGSRDPRPDPRPEDPPSDPPATEPMPPAGEPTTPVAKPARSAPPGEAELMAATKSVKELFQADLTAAKSAEQKRDLSQKLLKIAQDEAAGSAQQYAALDLARELATEALDGKALTTATEALAKQFDIEPLKLRQEALVAALAKPGSAAAKRPLVESLRDLIDELLEADQHTPAAAALAPLADAARELHDKELIQAAADRKKLSDDLAAKFKEVEPAFETLKTKPDDAAANLAVGRYVSLLKANFERGMPYLAKSEDAELAKLAKLEIANPDDPKQQVALADGWHAQAAKEPEKSTERGLAEERAALWYGVAVAGATGLDKERAQRRLAELPAPKVRPGFAIAPATYLDDLPELLVNPVEGTLGKHGQSGLADKPISWEGKSVEHSLFQHPPAKRVSTIQYELGGVIERFQATAVLLADEGRGGAKAAPVSFRVSGDGKTLWQSRPLTAAGEHQECDLKVAGIGVLRLETISTSDNPAGHLCWIDPRLLDAPVPSQRTTASRQATIAWLDELPELRTKNLDSPLGRRGQIDQRLRAPGDRVVWGNEPVAHSLFMHPESQTTGEAEFQLEGKYTRLVATAAMLVPAASRGFRFPGGGRPFGRPPFGFEREDPKPGGTAESPLVLRVLGDGKVLWSSKPMTIYGASEVCNISIRGVRELKLEVQCPEDTRSAWAAWIDPKLFGGPSATTPAASSEPGFGPRRSR